MIAHQILLGVSSGTLLHSTDHVERLVIGAATARAVELADVRDANLAVRIANNLGKVLGGG